MAEPTSVGISFVTEEAMKKHKTTIKLALFIIILLIVSIICFYESNHLSNNYTEEVENSVDVGVQVE